MPKLKIQNMAATADTFRIVLAITPFLTYPNANLAATTTEIVFLCANDIYVYIYIYMLVAKFMIQSFAADVANFLCFLIS